MYTHKRRGKLSTAKCIKETHTSTYLFLKLEMSRVSCVFYRSVVYNIYAMLHRKALI